MRAAVTPYGATHAAVTALDPLEAKLRELRNHRVFDDGVRDAAQRLLDSLPPVEEERDTRRKARLLLLRCQVRLLFPCVSKEAEADCNAALKLQHNNAAVWVELSECLLRRNAFKDACDALDSALRISPKDVVALCKYSQIQRNRCGEAGLSPAQRQEYVLDSVSKARAAVAAEVESSDAWYTLSLALLAAMAQDGLSVGGIRKALAAMQQAEKKAANDDPDVHYNKGVLESLLGHFGDACCDFARAHELDQHRLKGSKHFCAENRNVLVCAQKRMKNLASLGKREFKRLCASVAAEEKDKASAAGRGDAMRHAVVVDLVSPAVMQPLVLLVADASETFSFVLLYEVSLAYFKIGDLLAWPAAEPPVSVPHTVPALPLLGEDALSLSMPQYYVAIKDLLLNGKTLPTSARAPLQMSSRLFA